MRPTSIALKIICPAAQVSTTSNEISPQTGNTVCVCKFPVRGLGQWYIVDRNFGVTWLVTKKGKIMGWSSNLFVGCTLPWRHNDHDNVSNHQPHGCLLNRLFRRRSKKTSKLRVTGLCVGNSPGPVNSQHKGPVTQKMFPFDDVINEVRQHIPGGPMLQARFVTVKPKRTETCGPLSVCQLVSSAAF